MARGRVTAAYDSWLAVPFCLVLLVVGPSTALSQCYFTAFRACSLSVSSKPAMSLPTSCSFHGAKIKTEYVTCHNKRCSFFLFVMINNINIAFDLSVKVSYIHENIALTYYIKG